MNINFHYFVIKTLAIKSGLSENDAQFLACISQYVDDYNLQSVPIYLDDVPEYARHLTTGHSTKGWSFIPITTGFSNFIDDIRLIVNTKDPEMIVVPFHFIPQKKLNSYKIDKDDITNPARKELRTTPVTLDKPSLMQELLVNARQKYIEKNNKENLMRIAMLVHTFADTYAHQGFSGLWGWENQSRIKSVINNKTNENITKSYKINFYAGLPSLGHANVSTAPDDSYVEFEINYKSDAYSDYDLLYKRSNVQEFIKASKEILNYILSCQGKENVTKEQWEKLEPKLIKGLYGQTKDIEKCEKSLYAHWESIFNDINYSYNKDEVLIFKSDDFFRYNVIAKEIRDYVNGYKTPLI